MIFDRVYIEEDALSYELTGRIMSALGEIPSVPVRHYKDIFNRPGQDYRFQYDHCRSLILAVNRGRLVYEGAPLCQDFGMENLCYCSNVMGCVFDCDYCFIKGMYRTGNVVVFVNTDDYEKQVREMLRGKGKICLSVSYESDVQALDNLTGLSSFWERVASENEGLTIELRTKSAPLSFKSDPSVIYSFTLTPGEIRDRFEKGTAPLEMRIRSIRKAIEAGASVRIVFDPLIYVKDYEVCYNKLMDTVLSEVDLGRVRDIGVGSFRIPSAYLKHLRRASGNSSAVSFPFLNDHGTMRYPDEIDGKLKKIITGRLEGSFDAGRIYVI